MSDTTGANNNLNLVGEMQRIAQAVDSQFNYLLPVPRDPRAELFEAMRYATIGGGKRLRPFFGHRNGPYFQCR